MSDAEKSNSNILLKNLKIGDELAGFKFGPISSEHLIKWIIAAEDLNPVHYDKDFAVSQGQPGVLMQGPFKLSLMESHLRHMFGENSRMASITCVYRGTDTVGNTLSFRFKVIGIERSAGESRITIELKVENSKNVLSVEGKTILVIGAGVPSQNE